MANKRFKRDGNKVRKSTANISKMNPFQFAYFHTLHWEGFSMLAHGTAEAFVLAIKYAFLTVLALVQLVLFPIISFVYAFFEIKKAKKEMARIKREKVHKLIGKTVEVTLHPERISENPDPMPIVFTGTAVIIGNEFGIVKKKYENGVADTMMESSFNQYRLVEIRLADSKDSATITYKEGELQ